MSLCFRSGLGFIGLSLNTGLLDLAQSLQRLRPLPVNPASEPARVLLSSDQVSPAADQRQSGIELEAWVRGSRLRINRMQAVFECSPTISEPSHLLEIATCCIYAWVLLDGGLAIHSSALIHDSGIHVFTGRSGIGKTTMARMATSWGDTLVSDDQTLLLAQSNGWTVTGAWNPSGDGKPLVRIHALGRGEPTTSTPLSPDLAIPKVLAHCYTWECCSTTRSILLGKVLELVRRVEVRQLLVDLPTLTQAEVFG